MSFWGGPRGLVPCCGAQGAPVAAHLMPPAVMKTEWKESQEWKVQNDNKPLWVRPPREVTKDEYDSFFKTTFRWVP